MAEVKAKTVGKTLGDVEAEAWSALFPDTISEVVACTNADTLTCVKAKAPGKTKANTVAGLEKTQFSLHLLKLK